MRMWRSVPLCGAIALMALQAAATAAPLSVVTVSAPAINCVFETDCTLTVTDSVGTIAVPGLSSGVARLQSRTFPGKAGAPGAGKTAYEYRIDMSTAVTNADAACVTDVAIDFGPVAKLQYNGAGPTDDVYVLAIGGVGKIGLQSAEQTGNTITFTLSQPICAGQSANAANTTFFFGLASASEPRAITARVGIAGDEPTNVGARAPNHGRHPVPPVVLDQPAGQREQTGTMPTAAPNR